MPIIRKDAHPKQTTSSHFSLTPEFHKQGVVAAAIHVPHHAAVLGRESRASGGVGCGCTSALCARLPLRLASDAGSVVLAGGGFFHANVVLQAARVGMY